MSALFMAVGTCKLGQTKVDQEGNTVEHTQASFEPDPAGGCVVVGKLDLSGDDMKLDGPADIYGDYDAAGYLGRALEILSPGRKPNIPDFRKIIKGLAADSIYGDCPFIDHCEFEVCQNCIVSQWLEEEDAE